MPSPSMAAELPQDGAKPDLWKQALATLTAEDQQQYQDNGHDMLGVLKKV